MRSYVAAKRTIAADFRVSEPCRHIITPDTYERIEAHRLLHDKRQTVDALPEVCRARGHVDAQSTSWGDHGDAARIARIVLVNCASSMSGDTRKVTPSTTSSILHDFVVTSRLFGLREGRVDFGSTTSVANIGS